MKKKLSALLCALCMAMALCLTAFAAGTPTISGTAARNGSKVTLTLALDTAGAEFTSLQCDVHFDADKLEYDRNSNAAGNIEGVSFSGGADKGGYVTVLGDVATGDPFTASGTMVTLAFNVKEGATGDVAFTIDNIVGVNDAGDVAVTPNAIASIAVVDPEPTVAPTQEPTAAPTTEPTAAPTTEPTAAPTTEPTAAPTTAPTAAPTNKPTAAPTSKPTAAPTAKPAATSKPASSDKSTTTATATAAPAATTTTTAAIPQTGDNANLALYAVLCVASAIALGVVVYRKKANH